MKAIMASADTNDTAVATGEHSAAFVSFQRFAASNPPAQNVNSATSLVFPAAHFGGNNAICAEVAA